MRMRMILTSLCMGLFSFIALADSTVTVTATNADISEQLDLRIVANLFGQAKDLDEFEQMLNNPDSAFSNLDLNGDGDVDYLRVIETADNNRHLVVIQAVLAKDIYQDVASIFVEKDEKEQSVTVQVIGDEYIYGENYIIEPVYIYRPIIYDWFWSPSWVCWHSPYYWGYWPSWWHPYHCIAHHLYWDHCYWYHHHYPYCSYRAVHHHRPHYEPMRKNVSRSDYATRHPERSFATRNASRGVTNARDIDRDRRATMRQTTSSRSNASAGATRVSNRSTGSRTFNSANIRSNERITAAGNRASATRVDNASTRTSSTRNAAVNNTSNRSQSVTTTTRATPSRSSSAGTATRSSNVQSATRSSNVQSATRSGSTRSSSPAVRSSSSTRSSSATRSSSSSIRSSSSSMRSSGSSMRSGGNSSMRSSSSSSSRGSSGGSRTR